MVSGNEVHFCRWGFASAAFEPLKDVNKGSIAVP
jgi:hypothetical protein